MYVKISIIITKRRKIECRITKIKCNNTRLLTSKKKEILNTQNRKIRCYNQKTLNILYIYEFIHKNKYICVSVIMTSIDA